VVDLRDLTLPNYDLPTPPAMAFRQYGSDVEQGLGERLDAADGFIVITNEFNHGYSAALKNVLDHYFIELSHKPIAFLGYGNVGGARAIEQLRQVVIELDMVPIKYSVNIPGSAVLRYSRGRRRRRGVRAARGAPRAAAREPQPGGPTPRRRARA